MISVIIDPVVEQQLRSAFPSSRIDPGDHLAKYANALEAAMMDAMLHNDFVLRGKQANFYASTKKIANAGPQLGPSKLRLHKWLTVNQLQLIQVAEKGNKFHGRNSLVTTTRFVTVVPASSTMSPEEALEWLYPGYSQLSPAQISQEFHLDKVDFKSLNVYMQSLMQNGQLPPSDSKELTKFTKAELIHLVATHLNGLLPQRIISSPFGRTYYERLNVQNIDKEIRHALLGPSWEYDLRTAVVAWKLQHAQQYLVVHGIQSSPRTVFRYSYWFALRKKSFFDAVKKSVFVNSVHNDEKQTDILKSAMTSLNFGAKLQGGYYLDDQGELKKMAIASFFIDNKIDNPDDRKELLRFQQHPILNRFMDEQNKLNDLIIDITKQNNPNILNLPIVRTPTNRLSRSKLLAYLYQHAETEVMDVFRACVANLNIEVLANIHDAIILKTQLVGSSRKAVMQTMRQQTGNPFWYLQEKEIK
jgi:hypothetical protein